MQAEDPNDCLSASSAKLPAGVTEVRDKTFCPPAHQRGEGAPSTKLRQHLGITSRRRGSTIDIVTLMLNLFLFFFAIPILQKICDFTNEKATEIIWKSRQQNGEGKWSTKVRHECVVSNVRDSEDAPYVCVVIVR